MDADEVAAQGAAGQKGRDMVRVRRLRMPEADPSVSVKLRRDGKGRQRCRQRATALARSMSPATRRCAAARVEDGVLGAL